LRGQVGENDFFPKSERAIIVTHSFGIIVAITGASGSLYGIRLLEKLHQRPEVATHLILSRGGERTLYLETGKRAADLRGLAHHWHPPEDIGANIASGSYPIDAMVVAPCSIHTMSAIAHGISSNLIVRAADVTLKERRKLILMVRETPFHLGHLRSMTALAEMGAIISPPIPGFYHAPKTILDLVDHSVDRVLDLIGLPAPDAARWNPGKERDEKES
jgi:flavin prenyltransferase